MGKPVPGCPPCQGRPVGRVVRGAVVGQAEPRKADPEAYSSDGEEEAGQTSAAAAGELLHLAPAAIRAGFVRKVYAILSIQLVLTVCIAAPFSFMPKATVLEYAGVFRVLQWISLAFVVGVSCCCRDLARTYPWNFLILFTFTAVEALVIGFVTAMFRTSSVLLAGGICASVFVGLTIYACKTKSDFTGMGPYLFTFCWVLLLWGFIALLFPMGHTMHTAYGVLGALLFCFFIVYDTQLIVGGEHSKVQFEVDDYVFAALNLYLDIVNLFLYILSLLGDKRE